MQIEGTVNYHNTFIPTLLSIENQHGERIRFQAPKDSTSIRSFEHQLQDLPDIDTIETFKFTSEDHTEPSDTRIAFHYIVHPGIEAIIVPPNSIEMTVLRGKNDTQVKFKVFSR
ncbi:hypothetical protein K2X92_02195, partial [Candidatus Gracilibacteria bacterium]|nr:hypothetical protein [Candidatus Gracilibacteria bacterium]